MNALTAKEAEAWTSEMARVANMTIREILEAADRNNIEYVLKNDATGHFHCRRKSDDALVQFWAGTGKILGYTQRGIHNLIHICEEDVNE